MPPPPGTFRHAVGEIADLCLKRWVSSDSALSVNPRTTLARRKARGRSRRIRSPRAATVSPDTIAELAAIAGRRSVELLDSLMVGRERRYGELGVITAPVGGDEVVVRRVQGTLERFSPCVSQSLWRRRTVSCCPDVRWRRRSRSGCTGWSDTTSPVGCCGHKVFGGDTDC